MCPSWLNGQNHKRLTGKHRGHKQSTGMGRDGTACTTHRSISVPVAGRLGGRGKFPASVTRTDLTSKASTKQQSKHKASWKFEIRGKLAETQGHSRLESAKGNTCQALVLLCAMYSLLWTLSINLFTWNTSPISKGIMLDCPRQMQTRLWGARAKCSACGKSATMTPQHKAVFRGKIHPGPCGKEGLHAPET